MRFEFCHDFWNCTEHWIQVRTVIHKKHKYIVDDNGNIYEKIGKWRIIGKMDSNMMIKIF